MRFFNSSVAALLASLAFASPAPQWQDAPAPAKGSEYLTQAWREQFVQKYLAVASGNLSLIPEVYQENAVLYQDRNPEPPGSMELHVTSAKAYEEYVIHFRTGFSYYNAALRYYIAQDYIINIQWRVDAVVGNSSQLPDSPAQTGHKLSYNGTDTVWLNETTGLVYEIDSFFNIIDYDYQIGLKSVDINQIPGTIGCPVELGAPSCPPEVEYTIIN